MAKKAKKAILQGLCPCGSGRAFSDCCEPLLEGAAASSPEALMRSRYTAYALGNDAYVLATWAEETRPAELFAEGEPRPKWLSLRVLESAEEGDAGTVHFIARARTALGAVKLEERSTFRREADGRWVYVEGDLAE